jgi:hypothetical protein
VAHGAAHVYHCDTLLSHEVAGDTRLLGCNLSLIQVTSTAEAHMSNVSSSNCSCDNMGFVCGQPVALACHQALNPTPSVA